LIKFKVKIIIIVIIVIVYKYYYHNIIGNFREYILGDYLTEKKPQMTITSIKKNVPGTITTDINFTEITINFSSYEFHKS